MHKHSVLGITLTLGLLAAGAACSSSEDTKVTPTTDGGVVPPGNNPNEPNPTRPDGGLTNGPAKTGIVTLTQTSVNAGGMAFDSYSASAGFIDSTGLGGSGSNTACAETTDGSCTVFVCNKVMADAGTTADGGTAAKPPNAGDIDVQALASFKLIVDSASGNYTAKFAQEKLFDTGGQIRIAAAGADVPAFQETLIAPPNVVLTAPVLPALPTKYKVSGASKIDLTWTGGGEGMLRASIASSDATRVSSVSCIFDASTGSASIPASAIGKLVKGDGAFSTSANSAKTVKAGDYRVEVTASITGATALVTVE